MGGSYDGMGDQRICAACGQKDAPARCSRCLSCWFCGPECQRSAWPEHKLKCKSALERAETSKVPNAEASKSDYVWGAESDKLLWTSLCTVKEDALQQVSILSNTQNHLEALGTSMAATLESFHQGNDENDSLKAASELLWQRFRWEPHLREKHEYSLLHAIPAPETVAPEEMHVPETNPGNLTTSTSQRHEPVLAGGSCPVIDAKGFFSAEVKRQAAEYLNPRAPRPCIIKNLPIFQRAVEKWSVDYLSDHMGDQLYHTFASTQDARRFAYSFDCRNEGGYEPARIAEACKMTFKEFVTLRLPYGRMVAPKGCTKQDSDLS